jgi:hypothetical protein
LSRIGSRSFDVTGVHKAKEDSGMQVDFFVAGVQKGGTTALDQMLRRHSPIQMARVKEPHFFDDDAADWKNPDLRAYHDLFDHNDATGILRGEATPIYTFWPRAMERIAEYNPAARVIMCLRHPSLRAHSHWRMEAARGEEDLSFSEAIRLADHTSRSRDYETCERVYSYLPRGFYAPQVRRLRALFPRRQLLFVRTDELWSKPNQVLAAISTFLDIEKFPRVDRSTYHVPFENLLHSSVSAADRRYLDHLFAEDINETEQLTGVCLSDWKDPGYREPMSPYI